jgi:hypothetical protein
MRTILIMAPLLMAAGCNSADGQQRDEAGSRNVERRDVQVAGAFDKVKLSGSQNVIVRVGGAHSVRTEGEAGLLDRLEIAVRGNGELHIGFKKDKGWSWPFSRDHKPVTIFVTVPSLAAASIDGSGDVQVDRVEGGTFAGAVAGSGDLQIGAMKVGSATFAVAGSGDIRAVGTADSATLSVAGSGDIDTRGLQAKTAKVSIAGSGDIFARASETAEIELMGSGDVELSGGAECRIDKIGSGEVRCAG